MAVVALWVWVAWYIFRRIGFFGAQKPPRFKIEKGGRSYSSAESQYLINGIVGGRHIVYVFRADDGQPFVYLPRDKDVFLLGGQDELETYVRDHCGGEKGLAKLRLAMSKARPSS